MVALPWNLAIPLTLFGIALLLLALLYFEAVRQFRQLHGRVADLEAYRNAELERRGSVVTFTTNWSEPSHTSPSRSVQSDMSSGQPVGSNQAGLSRQG